MTKFTSKIRALRSDRRGVTALEYGMIAAVVALVMVVGASQLGTSLSNTFNSATAVIDSENP